ncbi:MAG: FHA domain-containing protein [Coriobacteriales bacterium]|nr:FHA domain-containing protein [Coriobacteriales bacterium]
MNKNTKNTNDKNDANQTFCPVCQKPVNDDATICGTCGFSLLGATQSFNPISMDTKLNDCSVETGKTKPALVIVNEQYKNETFLLNEQKAYTIGRDPNCDIFLSDRTVSRHHATIYISKAGAQIKDEDSMNGTWLNSHLIDTSALNPKDLIAIGTFTMQYRYVD